MSVLALDFEGSHLSTERGCPVQLGIALMDGEDVVAQDEWIIQVPRHHATGKPMKEVDAYSLSISGLTLERIEAEGLSSKESCQRLQDFVSKHDAGSLRVVCYNVSYDLASYRNMLFNASDWHPWIRGQRVAWPEILSPNWSCAMALARRRLPNLDNYKLDTVAEFFGLSRSSDLHGACEDAILAGRVYYRLLEMGKAVAA